MLLSWSCLKQSSRWTSCDMHVSRTMFSTLGHHSQSPATSSKLVRHERRFWGHRQTRVSVTSQLKCQVSVDYHTLKQSSFGKALNGSFFSLGLTIWCRKLRVWLSHSSTSDLSQFSFAVISKPLNKFLASSRIGSSTSSRARCHEVGDL